MWMFEFYILIKPRTGIFLFNCPRTSESGAGSSIFIVGFYINCMS